MFKMKTYLIFLPLLIQLTKLASSEPRHVIIAPPNVTITPYRFIVTLLDNNEPTTIESSLSCYSTITKKKTEFTKPFQSEVIIFEDRFEDIFKKYPNAPLTLHVEGKGFVNFTEDYNLTHVFKEPIILIQTDKKVYLPGQIVNLRILVLNDDMKPIEPPFIEDMKILIINPQKVIMRELNIRSNEERKNELETGIFKVNYESGTISGIAFSLNEYVRAGEWNIQVKTKGHIKNYIFEVKYDELPIANLTMNIPKFVKKTQNLIPYSISFLFFFGKPASGNYNLSISMLECTSFYSQTGRIDQLNENRFLKTDFINGNTSNTIPLKELGIYSSGCNSFKFNISLLIEETLTGKPYFTYDIFEVIENDIKGEIMETQKQYIPGQTISKTIKITNITGGIINDEILNKVECKAEITTQNEITKQKGIHITTFDYKYILKNGEIICELETKFDFNDIKFKVLYDGKILDQQQLILKQICQKDFIQVYFETRNQIPKIDQNIILSLKSSFKLDLVTLTVLKYGSILSHKIKSLKDEPNYKLDIMFTENMLPNSIILIYAFVPGKNSIVYDTINLRSNHIVNREIEFSSDKGIYEPGKKAQFTIKANENSKIFLLGLDNAEYNLGHGNDIDEDRIKGLLRNEKDSIEFSELTHSEMYTSCIRSEYYDEEPKPIHKPDKKLITRNVLRDTWIWHEFLPSEGETDMEVKMPESISSYKLTGFQINKETGLSLTKTPLKLEVFKNTFIKMNLPYSIIRGEVPKLNILIFNYDSEKEVTIKFSGNSTHDNEHIIFMGCDKIIHLKRNEIHNLNCEFIVDATGLFFIKSTIINENKIIDGEVKKILVKYEGTQITYSQSIFMNLTEEYENKDISYSIPISFPAERVSGSESLFASVTTEMVSVIWGKRLKEIKGISERPDFDFSQPDGCCQQRVADYFPKVFWLNYIKKTGKHSEKYKDAIKDVHITFENLCFHEPNDGSFVYFNSRKEYIIADKPKSFLWQTALTLNIMKLSSEYIKIQKETIEATINWLKQHQVNGNFIETDPEHEIYHTGTNAYLNSFVLLSLRSNIEPLDTLNILEKTYPNLINPLDKLASCYALTNFSHSFKDECYIDIMKISRRVNESLYWEKDENTVDLHATAYGLMLLIDRGLYTDALSVFKFLTSQQDPNTGVFRKFDRWNMEDSYIQMICTEALTKFLMSTSTIDKKFESIDLIIDNGYNKNITLKLNSKDVDQFIKLNETITSATFNVKGYGMAKFNVFYIFNMLQNKTEKFYIETFGETKEIFNLKVCIRLKRNETLVTNVITEIDLPSGYTYTGTNYKSETIDRIEPQNDGTQVIVYHKKVTNDNQCFTIPSIRSFNISNLQPFPIKVYEYYNRDSINIINNPVISN